MPRPSESTSRCGCPARCPVFANEETPVERVFRAWERDTENVAVSCLDKEMDDNDFTVIVSRQTDIEDHIAATPALNLRDFTMKAWARSSESLIVTLVPNTADDTCAMRATRYPRRPRLPGPHPASLPQ